MPLMVYEPIIVAFGFRYFRSDMATFSARLGLHLATGYPVDPPEGDTGQLGGV